MQETKQQVQLADSFPSNSDTGSVSIGNKVNIVFRAISTNILQQIPFLTVPQRDIR